MTLRDDLEDLAEKAHRLFEAEKGNYDPELMTQLDRIVQEYARKRIEQLCRKNGKAVSRRLFRHA